MHRQEWLTLLLHEIQESFLHTEVIADSTGKIIDLLVLEANPVAQRLIGKSREEIIGRTRHELIGKWLTDEESDAIQHVLTHQESRRMERYFHEQQKWADVSIYPSLPGRINIISRNITEQKLAEKKSREQERRIRLLIEHTPAAVAMLDRDMRYLNYSRRWITDYRLPEESIVGKSHYDVFPDLPLEWLALHQRCLSGETLSSEKEKFPRADGTCHWLRWELIPWYTEQLEIGGILIFSEIITETIEAQQALEQLNAELEDKIELRTFELVASLENEKRLGELKSKFVSMASHEFRTPLTSMLSSVHLIDQYVASNNSDGIQKHTDRIKSSIQHLVHILEDFLTIDKLESGKRSIELEEFNLHALVNRLMEDLSNLLKSGQTIRLLYSGPHVCYSDAHVLKSILINLLSNAIKYSPEQTVIEFRVNYGDEFKIEIQDQGIGIPEADLSQIFSKFFRAGNTGKISGTGLGLNIVQRYVELLNGEITLQSRENMGTCFRVRFPLTQK